MCVIFHENDGDTVDVPLTSLHGSWSVQAQHVKSPRADGKELEVLPAHRLLH